MTTMWRHLTFATTALFVLNACGGSDESTTPTKDDPPDVADEATTEEVAAPEGAVSRAELGDSWPLTVDSGVLHCSGASAVTFEADGVVYAVNGSAMGANAGADIEPIWADNPEIEGTKKSIGPLIDRGLALCD